MEKWKEISLSKEEEEGVTADVEEIGGEEIFQRTLAGKLWSDNSFNSRAFISTMIGAWKLKNPVDTQELSKNLFLFRFSTRRDLENVLRNGPWSFDRHLLVLSRLSGEEQPSALKMHFDSLWVRVYELPLLLRTEAMAKKLGGILGSFEEMDQRDVNRNGRFLRIKVSVDLQKPLKRGTVVRFKEKNLKVFFKYERLPTFCFVCGKLGHQLKDCETVGELSEEGFEELEEQELAYGTWLRASPLPRTQETSIKKESNSGSCSKSLFNISSGHSKEEIRSKEKSEEVEVNKPKEVEQRPSPTKVLRIEQNTCEQNPLEIEAVAESFSAVDISNVGGSKDKNNTSQKGRGKKWTRRNVKGKKPWLTKRRLRRRWGRDS
ncbi:uncharacterized protein LOC131632840 [Vicia villosa]|uniref:uncharacterized protein LOC131632840 n=1 Tax=Vicia villosa TaxID=3911 RepID=UPI00273CB79F|nr:uncharacterized protein LOC131632840 [Vicia villosa]